MIFYKEHFTQKGNVLAACDSELINEVLKEGELEIEVTESFFGAEKATEEEFINLLDKHGNVNLIGNKVVEIAVKEGKVKNYSLINGVKMALILSI